MRFMVLVKADERSEAGKLPDEQELKVMGKFNDELVRAGVLLAGEGLHPTSKGARLRFSGGKCTVVDGPFAETRELVAGFWLVQVKSREELLEWFKRGALPGRRAGTAPGLRGVRLRRPGGEDARGLRG